MKHTENRKSEKEILEARLDEAEERVQELRKAKRDYLTSHASDQTLDLMRPFLNVSQQDSLRRMDAQEREVGLLLNGLRRELVERFPAPMPAEPPKWEIDPVVEAARSGKTVQEIQALKALINHTPANAGFNSDRALRRRWEGGEVQEAHSSNHSLPSPTQTFGPKKGYG